MRLRWALIALALACLLQGASVAAADYPVRGRQLTRIELEGSDGYSITIASDRTQHLTVETKKEAFTTEYFTHNSFARPGGIQAELPGLGSISVRFHPRGRARRMPPFADCRGPRPVVQKGVVRGVIDFTGEHGYTQVKTHEAPAEIEEWKRLRCHSGGGPESGDILELNDSLSMFLVYGPSARFVARKFPPGALEKDGVAFFLAETGERVSARPFVGVERRAVVAASPGTFADGHPEHIVVSPPPPFAGSATFLRTPESVFTWEGDLSIQFPGLDPLPLAGPGSDLKYCLRKTGCIRQQPPPDHDPVG
jgi:hypothetical protein